MATETKKKSVTFRIAPNDERVIIRLVQITREMSPILMPGQLKSGDALHCGEIIHPGNTKFKKSQIVYYSEYSAAKLTNIGSVLRGEQTMGEIMASSEKDVHVVAADDIMAYEEKVFDWNKKDVGLKKEDDTKQVSKIVAAR